MSAYDRFGAAVELLDLDDLDRRAGVPTGCSRAIIDGEREPSLSDQMRLSYVLGKANPHELFALDPHMEALLVDDGSHPRWVADPDALRVAHGARP